MEFVDIRRQFKAYREEIQAALDGVLKDCRFILGDRVTELEQELAAFVGQGHGIAVGSGTDGLMLSLMALGVEPGDVVITTPFTFIATAEVIEFLGARSLFVDIEPQTFNIDPRKVKEAIKALKTQGASPKGIIAVSLFGQCPDMDELLKIQGEYGIFILEDACQSLGATYKGRRSCGLTEVSVTSFFPAKPLGCYGDGGMIFCGDDELAEQLRMLRNHGQRKRYVHEAIGVNSRLDAIQAAVLLVKLRHFEAEIEMRRKAARRYDQMIEALSLPIITPYVPEYNNSVYAQYTIRVLDGRRDHVREILRERGIPTAVHYPRPLHLQPAMGHLGYRAGEFPVSEKASKEVLSLPFHPFITKEEQEHVVEALKDGF